MVPAIAGPASPYATVALPPPPLPVPLHRDPLQHLRVPGRETLTQPRVRSPARFRAIETPGFSTSTPTVVLRQQRLVVVYLEPLVRWWPGVVLLLRLGLAVASRTVWWWLWLPSLSYDYIGFVHDYGIIHATWVSSFSSSLVFYLL
jgi:hypothetical protein